MDEVTTERDGQVLVVTINRPTARNAINSAVAQGIAKAMDALDGEADLVVGILTGAGGNFCAGMDLKAFLVGDLPYADGRGFGGIAEAPPKKPIIAAVEGYALAGGCELVLSCDIVVAADNAKFGLPEVTRGLVAGAGGLFRLPSRVPRQVALEYALTGQHFGAADARQWGLVNRVTPPGQALDGARELARAIAKNAPLAVQMTKRIMSEAAGWPLAEVWERQRSLVASVFGSEDAREGAAAFAEKRVPAWRGR